MPETQLSDDGHLVRQLTSFDAQFLAIEDARNFSHVSGLAILDPSTAPGGELVLADLQAPDQERIHLIPPFRWRLAEVPFGIDHPWWVEDPDFDIEFHVRELALPRPGNDEQLTAQVERLISRPLDRSRPLWEIYLIQGLRGRQSCRRPEDPPRGRGRHVRSRNHGHPLRPRTRRAATSRQSPKMDEGERIPTSLELLGRGVFGMPRRIVKAAVTIPAILPNIADVPTLRALPGVERPRPDFRPGTQGVQPVTVVSSNGRPSRHRARC